MRRRDQPTPGPTSWLDGDRRKARRWDTPRPADVDGGLRVSDAERSAVTDILSRSYLEGYLDQSEHDDRMTCAMAAKTRSQLADVLADLPRAGQPPVERRRRIPTLVAAAAAAFVVLAAAATTLSHLPVLLVGVGVLWLWHRSAPRRRRWRPPDRPPPL